jgi:putative transposase
VLEIVEHESEEKGFRILLTRRVIERTFGWFEWYRHLSKDF